MDNIRCDCPDGKKCLPCIHKAAVMIRLEKEHGPFIAKETDWDYRERKTREAIEEEKERLQKLKEKLGTEPVPVSTYFKKRKKAKSLIIWDVESALNGYSTNAYEMKRADEIENNNQVNVYIEENTGRDGTREMTARCSVRNSVEGFWREAATARMIGDKVKITEYCNEADFEDDSDEMDVSQFEDDEDAYVLNAPELLMLKATRP